MRLFKRQASSPPRLVRLALLEEGGMATTTTAPPGARLSLPSCFSECNIDDLMACAETPKSRKGFSFPWPSRKHSAPKKYAVNPQHHQDDGGGGSTLMRSAVSQLSLNDCRWKSFPKKSPEHASFPSTESLNNNNNNYLECSMYRSVSTSALLEDPKESLRSVEIEVKSCEELIDRCVGPPEGHKPAVSQLGTVIEEDRPTAEDTESLASSIQHRSDESGYESDGAKNGTESPDNLKAPDNKLAALFQRLTQSSSDEYEGRSLRLRAPAILSNLVHQKRADSQQETKKEPRTNKLGQFKAWTLDRKLLRSRWKKSPEDKLDIAVPARRGSIFQSSLFPATTVPEDSPSPVQLESKSLPCEPHPLSDNLASLSNCGGLNYQLRLKKAGYKSASSTNNARRRLWLQSQLSSCSDSEDLLSPDVSDKNLLSPPGEKPRRIPSQLDLHELVSVDLKKDEHGELGIYITGCRDSEKNVLGYIIVDFEKYGPAERSGKLLKGDELLMVNGQQLQGVTLEEARRLLRVPESEVHLLVARELPEDLCYKEEASRLPSSLPPVPELHESSVQTSAPRLRHWNSDVSSMTRADNRLSHPDLAPQLKADNERMGSNGICTLPRRPKSSQLSLHTVVFEKGPGRKSLGFSIVGGKDSPKGELGFYVKTIFANGQAAETGCLREGDEIYTLNGQSLQGLSHSEAIAAFKKIKQGPVVLHIGRRTNKKSSTHVDSSKKLESNNSKSCSTLDNI